MRIVDAHKYACVACAELSTQKRTDQSVLKKSCSHRPVADKAWRSSLSQRGDDPQGRGYSANKNGPIEPCYSLLELTHDRCTRFRLGKANRLRIQQARL